MVRAMMPQAVFAEHLQFAKQCAEPLTSAVLPHANDRSPSRRLKIGYVSPDFRRHSVNYFLEPVLAAHSHDSMKYSAIPMFLPLMLLLNDCRDMRTSGGT